MPYIPQDLINGTFYLYRTVEDAQAGKHPAGSGFVVRYDGPPGNRNWMQRGTQHYGVTNWHVAVAEGASVIRLNTKDGGTDIIEYGPEQWCFDPGKHDIAIVSLTLNDQIHSVSAVSTSIFFKELPNMGRKHLVGVGDDVFMIGLFVDHDGFTTNVPSARFGNVSMMPNSRAKILQSTGYRGESYVIDMHSRSGFSGSPVYVYRTFGSDLVRSLWGSEVEVTDVKTNDRLDRFSGRMKINPTLFKLLGIHWGQFPERWQLKDGRNLSEVDRNLITDGAYVDGLSGMTCVIAAEEIWNVLELPELKAHRDDAENSVSKQMTAKSENR